MTDIFISYNHKDEAWKDELQAHLEVLQHHGEFSVWEDRQIQAGDDWYPEIKGAIRQAKVAILLVSRDFLISDFVNSEEIPELLKRRKEDGLRVIPLVIRPCAWRDVPWLSSLQGAMKDNQPLSRFDFGSFELEHALSEFTSEVHRQLKAAKAQEEAVVEEVPKPKPTAAGQPKDNVVREIPDNADAVYKEAKAATPDTRKSRAWLWVLLAVPVVAGALYFMNNFGARTVVTDSPAQQIAAVTDNKPVIKPAKPSTETTKPEPTLDDRIKQARTWLESEDATKERLAVEQLKQLQDQDARAKFMLGAAYFYGLGVDQNKAKGCDIYAEAAEAGSNKAKEILDAKLCE